MTTTTPPFHHENVLKMGTGGIGSTRIGWANKDGLIRSALRAIDSSSSPSSSSSSTKMAKMDVLIVCAEELCTEQFRELLLSVYPMLYLYMIPVREVSLTTAATTGDRCCDGGSAMFTQPDVLSLRNPNVIYPSGGALMIRGIIEKHCNDYMKLRRPPPERAQRICVACNYGRNRSAAVLMYILYCTDVTFGHAMALQQTYTEMDQFREEEEAMDDINSNRFFCLRYLYQFNPDVDIRPAMWTQIEAHRSMTYL